MGIDGSVLPHSLKLLKEDRPLTWPQLTSSYAQEPRTGELKEWRSVCTYKYDKRL
jgi:hypothetical protein